METEGEKVATFKAFRVTDDNLGSSDTAHVSFHLWQNNTISNQSIAL